MQFLANHILLPAGDICDWFANYWQAICCVVIMQLVIVLLTFLMCVCLLCCRHNGFVEIATFCRHFCGNPGLFSVHSHSWWLFYDICLQDAVDTCNNKGSNCSGQYIIRHHSYSFKRCKRQAVFLTLSLTIDFCNHVSHLQFVACHAWYDIHAKSYAFRMSPMHFQLAHAFPPAITIPKSSLLPKV